MLAKYSVIAVAIAGPGAESKRSLRHGLGSEVGCCSDTLLSSTKNVKSAVAFTEATD